MTFKIRDWCLALAIAVIAAGIVGYMQPNRAEQEQATQAEQTAQAHAATLAASATSSTSHRDPGTIHFDKGEPQLSALRSAVVSAEAIPTADPVNGRYVYDENATSRVSSPLAGRVIGLRLSAGDRVSRGTALLEIDSPELAGAEADQAKAVSDEWRKRLAYERARQLHEQEVIARKELETADADYQQAQADARRASARLRNLQASGHQNGKFVLRAPIDGVIVERHVNLGQELHPGTEPPLFLISDVRRLWVLVDVPEHSLAHVHVGQKVSIDTDAFPGQHFSATVDRVGVTVDPVTRRVQVRCVAQNPDGQLKPDMFARVSFVADGERTGIRVPNSALVTEGIYVYAFVETEPGTFLRRPVTLALRGTEHSFVDSGLSEGDRVVVEGALLLNAEAATHAR